MKVVAECSRGVGIGDGEGVWKVIISGWEDVNNITILRMGNERSQKFWIDK